MEKTADANLFWVELERARTFEQEEATRHRGLVVLWIGLFAMFFGLSYLMPQLDSRTPGLTVELLLVAVLAYLLLLIGLAAYFRYSFRWTGVWRQANAWSWDGLGGFIIAFMATSGAATAIRALTWRSNDPFGEQDWARIVHVVDVGFQLGAVAAALLAINIAARNRTEILVGLCQLALAVVAVAFAASFVAWVPLFCLAFFVPTIVLGVVRLVVRRGE